MRETRLPNGDVVLRPDPSPDDLVRRGDAEKHARIWKRGAKWFRGWEKAGEQSEAKLKRERDDARAALTSLTHALCRYVTEYGLIHEPYEETDPETGEPCLAECLEDDTCECEMTIALSAALDSAIAIVGKPATGGAP